MPTKPGDHNPAPSNSTFASRATERDGKPAVRAPRRGLRAGLDAESDFTITHTGGGDRVQSLRTT